jgi:hypothetical protein
MLSHTRPVVTLVARHPSPSRAAVLAPSVVPCCGRPPHSPARPLVPPCDAHCEGGAVASTAAPVRDRAPAPAGAPAATTPRSSSQADPQDEAPDPVRATRSAATAPADS